MVPKADVFVIELLALSVASKRLSPYLSSVMYVKKYPGVK